MSILNEVSVRVEGQPTELAVLGILVLGLMALNWYVNTGK